MKTFIQNNSGKIRLAVLITPYGPVKPYGSTEYIGIKNEIGHIYISFFRYLARFEPEQKVTIDFLY